MEVDLTGFEAHLKRRGASAATITTYLQAVGHEGGPERVRDRDLAPKSRGVVLAAWRAYGRFLIRRKDPAAEELLADLADVRLPSLVRQRPQMPLPRPVYDALREELREGRAWISPPARAALGIMVNRGLRSIDVRRIRRGEVDEALKTGVLSFRAKGDRRLEFGVTSNYRPYLELLAEHFGHGGTVTDLLSETGNPPEERSRTAAKSIWCALKKVARELPLEQHGVELADVRPHILRRTYASIFFEACGRDVVRLQQHMQWANIQTAANYVDHARRAELDQVAEDMLR